MFKLHRNRSRQERHPSRKRSRILAGVLAGVFGAGVALTAAASLGAGVASADTRNDTTTLVYHGIEIPGGKATYLPRMQCPADYPYTLNQMYNAGTGFRVGEGIEFTDWKQGFDVVALSSLRQPTGNGNEWVRTGIDGAQDFWLNSATYWGWPWDSTGWTLNLHCTSNPDKAVYEYH